jgi:hypothetical protein
MGKLAIVLVLFLAPFAFYGIDSMVRTNLKQISPTNTPSPSPTAIPQPTNTPEPTIKKVQYKPVPTVDPNPYVDCKYTTECGGGTVKIRKSECDKSTCCQIGDKWVVYPSHDACTQAQSSTSKSNLSNRVPVYLPNLVGGTTVYCSPENVSAVKGMDADIPKKEAEIQPSYNSCYSLNVNNNPTDSCKYLRSSIENLIKQIYNLCPYFN